MDQHYLRQTLADNDIHSFESLYKSLESDRDGDLHLNVETRVTLRLDSEDRSYDEIVQFRSKVIRSTYAAKDSKEISFVDCVIDGSLFISDNSDKLKKIFFDYLIVNGSVVINLDGKTSVEVSGLNCKHLTIRGGKGCKVCISSSNIFHILFENVDFSSLRCTTNRIGKIELCSAHFEKVDFDHRQIDFSLIDAQEKSKTYEKKLKNHNLFIFFSPHEALYSIFERSEHTSRRETLNFLASNPDLYADRRCLSQIRTLQARLYSSNSKASYCFMRAFGHFTKPTVFLIYMLAGLLLFAAIFYFPAISFSVGECAPRPLSFNEALYFSGITMTTIGYGDITPLGWVRLLTVLEGVWGVSMMSAFIVALYRRYVER